MLLNYTMMHGQPNIEFPDPVNHQYVSACHLTVLVTSQNFGNVESKKSSIDSGVYLNRIGGKIINII
jgi:hypothetical protein